jgi:prolipoprotein diacylglyceryltransferase
VTLVYFVLYGVARIVLEMFRDDPRGTVLFGLSTSQFISLGLIAIAFALFPLLRKTPMPDSPFRPGVQVPKWAKVQPGGKKKTGKKKSGR